MPGTTTTYDVVTRYLLETRGAGQQLEAMDKQMHSVARSSEGVSFGFKRIAEMAMGAFGLHEAKKHLIDFSSEMEQAKLTTAGFMAMSGLGEFKDNLGQADALVKQYTIDARTSIATTADFVEMSKNLTASVTGAGGSVKDLHDMTKGLVIAAKAMHMDPNFAAMETEEALMGVLSVRNRFAKKILGSIGYSGEEGRSRYTQLSAKKRLAEFQRAMGADWLKDLSSAQQYSFEGARTTFIDNAQLAALRAGKPLFEAIKNELNKWNDYLIGNGAQIDHFADVVGGKLLTAAIAFKDTTVFLYEHWKGIALIWGTMRVGGIAGNIMNAGGFGSLAGWQGAGGGVAGAAGIFGYIKSVFAAAGKKEITDLGMGMKEVKTPMSAFAAQLGIATVALTGLAIGAQQIAKWVDSSQSRQLERAAVAGSGTMGAALASMKRGFGGENELRQQLYSAGLASDSGLNRSAFSRAFQESGQSAEEWAKNLGIKAHTYMITGQYGTMAASYGNTIDDILNLLAKRLEVWNPDHSGLNTDSGLGFYGKYNVANAEAKKPKVNVTINRIEVTSEDPDRFAFGFVGAMSDMVKNPSSALNALREG